MIKRCNIEDEQTNIGKYKDITVQIHSKLLRQSQDPPTMSVFVEIIFKPKTEFERHRLPGILYEVYLRCTIMRDIENICIQEKTLRNVCMFRSESYCLHKLLLFACMDILFIGSYSVIFVLFICICLLLFFPL